MEGWRRTLRHPSLVFAAASVVAVALGGAVFTGVLASPADGGDVPRLSPEVPITAMDQSLAPANNSPKLVADPTDDRFLVIANRLDAPDFDCALQISGDGGKGWLPVQPVLNLPPGVEKCYAPEVAFDSSGALYYLFIGLAGPGNEPVGVFLTTTTDRARSFTSPRQVLGPLNFGVRMAIDRSVGMSGRMHLVWLNATSDPPLGGLGSPPNPILSAYSDDGGETFSTPVQVSDPTRSRVAAPALVLGPDHSVHIAYYDLQKDAIDYQGLEGPTWSGTWSVVVTTSLDDGRSFSFGVSVDDEIQPHERVMLIFTLPPPSLVAGPGGRLCSSWTDARHGDADVILKCSSDGGDTWGQLVRVNDDPVGNGSTQYMPQLSIAPDGRLDAVFYDRREDPQNTSNDVFFTFSLDSEIAFSPNIKLTQDPSSSRIGQQYVGVAAQGLVEFGSRLALFSETDRAIAVWTDTRNSRGATTGQDLFLAAVRIPEQSVPYRLAGSLFILIGLVTLVLTVRTRRRKTGGDVA